MESVTTNSGISDQIKIDFTNSIKNVRTCFEIGMLAGVVSSCACVVFGLDSSIPATVTMLSTFFYFSVNQSNDIFTLGEEVLNNFLADREQEKAKQE